MAHSPEVAKAGLKHRELEERGELTSRRIGFSFLSVALACAAENFLTCSSALSAISMFSGLTVFGGMQAAPGQH
jgi:hypothetical protein